MNEILTLDYPKPYLGNYINRWLVVNVATRGIKYYKTEAGALRQYNAITSHAALYRGTDCKGADMLILTK